MTRPATSQPSSHASGRAWLFVLLTAVALMLLLLPLVFSGSKASDSTPQAESPAAPPIAAVDETVVQRCAATALVETTVRMQPEERGDDGTRTLGTLTITTASTEPLQVWVLVDEGEIGESSWSREGWQSNGGPLSSGGSVEERLSQTDYDDGDSTWRIINGVAAWRTGPECADPPTDAQLNAIAAPL